MTDRTDVGTVDDIRASATKLVGLDDFGADDDNYVEAIEVLLDSYRRDAGLTALGSKMSRIFLRGALAARLLIESAASPAIINRIDQGFPPSSAIAFAVDEGGRAHYDGLFLARELGGAGD